MQKLIKQMEKAAIFVKSLSKMRNSHKDNVSGSLTSLLDYTSEYEAS